jgi:glycosyltransferase involved in cell wall biosynthesis
VLQLLRAQYPDATLTLIGRCDSRFLDVMKSADAAGVELTGPLTEAAMQTHLDASHFFLFLSAWFGEGHSNALTEAMARGCVPIVSRQGFSESVVGEAELVMPDRDDAAAIAAAIEAIWEKGAWPDLSDRMVSRVAEHFTDRQALAVLEQVYGEGT